MDEDIRDKIKDRELTPQQQERVHDFMRKRFDTAKYQKYASDDVDIGSQLDVETGDERGIYVMFTHLLWDAAIDKQVSRVFADHNDWVTQTIERFRDGDGQLVVKTHPAETIRGTNEGVMDVIDRELASVPPNVDVLLPDTNVNTYDLIEFADTSLVFASTTGLESSYMGTPAITVGDAHYANKGFTHDAANVEEYWELLDADTETLSLSETEQQQALNYTYNFFVERPFYIDAINPPQLDGENERLVAIDSYQELIEDDTLDRLGDSIIQDDNWIYYR
jgi:capsule polysaccharide export protein KpsC/LpsZ